MGLRTWRDRSRRSREERRLVEAMQAAPVPPPPDGLRDRLLEEALRAARAQAHSRRRGRPGLLWAPAGMALLAIAVWLAAGRIAPTRPEVARRPAVSAPAAQRKAVASTAPEVARGPAPPSRRPERKPAARPRIARRVAAPAPLGVSVSRTREGAGFAWVAADDVDGEGRRVRTEWSLVEDGTPSKTRDALRVAMAGGAEQTLSVAVVASGESQGDEL